MLTKLYISNFGLIDEINIDFQKGLTIITGETGTGKSLLLGALGLILGKKSDSSLVLNKSKKSIIEASFSFDTGRLEEFFTEQNIDKETPTLIRRELLPSGKSKSFINDTPVSLETLSLLSKNLIDIHAQYDDQLLYNTHHQLQLLDALCNHTELLNIYQDLFKEYQKVERKLTQLQKKQKDIDQSKDYKNFLSQELQMAQLIAGEQTELEKEQNHLTHAENIQKELSQGLSLLDEESTGILQQLNVLKNHIERSCKHSNTHGELLERIQSSLIDLNDIHAEILQWHQTIESRPGRLEEVNQKLGLIYHLQKKHHVNTTEALIEIKENLESDLNHVETVISEIDSLQEKSSSLQKRMENQAQKIHHKRKQAALELEKRIKATLDALGIIESQLKVHLFPSKNFHEKGKDEIKIHFSANKGIPLQELTKVASGGERSQLMLAMKNILAIHENLATLILDEIDTGVSGQTADKIGDILQEMSLHMQLIVITHLPQIAAKGFSHWKDFFVGLLGR